MFSKRFASLRKGGRPVGILVFVAVATRVANWLVCASFLLSLVSSPSARAATISLSALLSEMADRAAVARFPQPAYECLQASSYNRASTNRHQPNQDTTGWFADSDGLGFLRTEQIHGRTEWVILDHTGPGCLTTFWTPFFYYAFENRRGPNIRIYLDGSEEPVIDENFIRFVRGQGSVSPPFSTPTARAGDCYLPVPFARSCKVTMTDKPFYYHINFRAYPKGTTVETFTQAAYASAASDLEKVGRALTAPPEPERGDSLVSGEIAPGGSLELAVPPGPAALRQLTIRIPAAVADPSLLRSTVLSIDFDGEQTVWCPVGDFFCSADAVHPLQTWQRTVLADGTMICRWVMPYRQQAKLKVLNLGKRTAPVSVQAEVTPQTWDDQWMHFHANWRTDDVVPGTPFRDWNYIDIQGQGVFVGDAWTVLNPQGSWWGEGDEKIYVDAAWDQGFPTHFGTGTEDYYGWAGGVVPTRADEFSVPFLANARVGGLDGQTTGFNICTRTRSLDAIPFHHRLVFDMESSFGTDIRNPWNLLGYSAVTFWYAKPGASDNRPPQPSAASRPIMALADLQRDSERIHALLGQTRNQAAIVFTQRRNVPIRPGQGPLEIVRFQRDPKGPPLGPARPGEFFVFQIGVYALTNTAPLEVTFGDLKGEVSTIPASAFRCLSLGGTNFLGQPFQKAIRVKPGQLEPLWVGLAVPDTAQGVFKGRAEVRVGPGPALPVDIVVSVDGAPVSDAGDSQARNLSRLRWLDSTVGSQPTLTAPFTPVEVNGRTIRVLGRELVLGDDGLPAQIFSHFSPANTRIVPETRALLARPISFVLETDSGAAVGTNHFVGLHHTDLEANWAAHGSSDGLSWDLAGQLNYTGSGQVRLHLQAEHDLELRDARLEVPFQQDAARYFMGLDHRGGRRPDAVHWQWNIAKQQDCFWLGDVNAGLMLRFKDAAYRRPAVNIYYAFRPLLLPVSWGNSGHGGIDLDPPADGRVLARAYSGPRHLHRGETFDFDFDFYLTPFRPIDTEKQWAVRFAHVGGPGREQVDKAVLEADARSGPNVVNVHQASFYAPYINYPYSDDSFPAFRELVQRAHAKDVRLRVYYTTREITQNMPELIPLHSFDGEIILPGPGRDARTLIHPRGPHPWLVENLVNEFVPAWEAHVGAPYADLDLSVLTTPDSRWNNFYLQGLQWLVDKSDFDGIYIDDTALDGTSLRRARRILDSRPGRLIDLHTWNHFNQWAGFANNLNLYTELLPYLDRLWLGEGFDANAVAPDYWLVEMSGLPFGLMADMLEGANPWRGMVFGETGRYPWAGDPRGLWRVWDEFGLRGTEMLPYFIENCPIKTDSADVLATVYRKPGRSFVALGSWAKEKQAVRLTVNWNALGLDPARAHLYAPAIQGMQPERHFRPDEPIPVEPKHGWFLILDEVQRVGDAKQPTF